VVGGVRRSALISLSNLTDERMRDAKSGAWWNENPQRALANNSVAYKEKPEIGVFMDEWVSLYKSKSGERGIFNRDACRRTVSKLGERRDSSYEFGTNPCSEIILRDREFCNLTEVVIRPHKTQLLVRFVLPLFLEHGKHHLHTSHIFHQSGRRIVKKKHFLEFHSLVF